MGKPTKVPACARLRWLRLLGVLLAAYAARSLLLPALRMHSGGAVPGPLAADVWAALALKREIAAPRLRHYRWCTRAGNASAGDPFPGGFADDRLYLQGARLTTSYEAAKSEVHVDLFGFAVDLLRPASYSGENFCGWRNESVSGRRFNQTLLTWDELRDHAAMYCQLDCRGEGQPTPRVRMTLVPTKSADGNQDRATVVWRCNVTDQFDRMQLRRELKRDWGIEEAPPVLPVRFLMQYQQEPLTVLPAADIRLDTGVVGYGGPQIRSTSAPVRSVFLETPVPAGICIATHGLAILNYVEECVQHHLNVGFGSIVIGIRGGPDSEPMQKARRLLQRYIEAGVVTLAYHGLPEDWRCDHGVEQLQFFQTCLFHHKGITRYSGQWDIDEYWIPPKLLHVNGRHGLGHHKFGVGPVDRLPMGQDKSSVTVTASAWSSFPRLVREDPLWRQSQYARSVSIGDTMAAVDRYYGDQNCTNAWCFHVFPSRILHLKDGRAKRRNLIHHDFERVEPNESNAWQKSIVDTRFTYLNGIHLSGSCLFESPNVSLPAKQQMRQYHRFAAREECHPSRFGEEVYGGMHHLPALLYDRDIGNGQAVKPHWEVDAYVQFYASTVAQQLSRNDTYS